MKLLVVLNKFMTPFKIMTSKQLSDIDKTANYIAVMKYYTESQIRGTEFNPRQVHTGISVEEVRRRLAMYADYEVPHPTGLRDALRYEFPNGYGISIIRNEYTHGASEGSWEAALLKDGKISFREDIFENDVEGHLTVKDIKERIEQIMSFV